MHRERVFSLLSLTAQSPEPPVAPFEFFHRRREVRDGAGVRPQPLDDAGVVVVVLAVVTAAIAAASACLQSKRLCPTAIQLLDELGDFLRVLRLDLAHGDATVPRSHRHERRDPNELLERGGVELGPLADDAARQAAAPPQPPREGLGVPPVGAGQPLWIRVGDAVDGLLSLGRDGEEDEDLSCSIFADVDAVGGEPRLNHPVLDEDEVLATLLRGRDKNGVEGVVAGADDDGGPERVGVVVGGRDGVVASDEKLYFLLLFFDFCCCC